MKKLIMMVITISLFLLPSMANALEQGKLQELKQLENLSFNKKDKEVIVTYKKTYDKRISQRAMDNIQDRDTMAPNKEIIKMNDKASLDIVMKELKRNPSIETVELNKVCHLLGSADFLKTEFSTAGSLAAATNDPYFSKQWWLEAVKAPEAWEGIAQKRPIVVAVIDSGIDMDHEDLRDKVAPGGYNFLLNSYDVYDINGHGTAVSGVVASQANNLKGICGVTGPFDVQILPLQAAYNDGTLYVSDIIRAIYYAIEKNVDVINLSSGGLEYSEAFNQAIQDAISKNIVVVASAGNQGDHAYFYPASYNNVLSAGAISPSGHIAAFSNHNDQVDLVAPGEYVYTTNTGNSYAYMAGTSFSAPIVSGAVALAKAVNPTLTSSEVINVLEESAEDRGQVGKDDYYGFGLININQAIFKLTNEDTRIAVESVSLNKTSLRLMKNQSEKLTATVLPVEAVNKAVWWSTDNPDVATVDQVGTVTAISPGNANITATTVDGNKTFDCVVTVMENNYGELPAKTSVPINKAWTIKFNMALEPSSVSNQNIYVLDNEDNSIPVSIEILQDGMSVLVTPAENYIKGYTYYLYIENTMKSHAGSQLKEPLRMKFDIVNN